jgi:hypothetical protein
MSETYAEASERNKSVDPKEVYPMATVPLTYENTASSHNPIFGFTCTKCGNHAATTYIKSTSDRMVELGLCFYCLYDVELIERLEKNHARMTIIDGHIYGPGSRTTGDFRGMAGRRFDIEYIEPSVWAGHKVTTFDLWSGAGVPDDARGRFPDTARFLNGAEKVALQGKIKTAWEGSSRTGEPFPLPNTLPEGGPK